MKKITSRQNPDILKLAKLKSSKERTQQGRFLAEGARVIATLCKSRSTLLHLYTTEKKLLELKAINFPLPHSELITCVTTSVMHKISHLTTPSDLVGVFQLQKKPSLTTLGAGIVFANVSDPGNMGTLFRTCAAIGKKSAVVIAGVDPWNQKVIQASAGTIGILSIFQTSWQELLECKKDFSLVGLVAKGGTLSIENVPKESLLVVGNEAHGIPQDWLVDCDALVTLQMPGKTESLNAAVAGSIAMYELWTH